MPTYALGVDTYAIFCKDFLDNAYLSFKIVVSFPVVAYSVTQGFPRIPLPSLFYNLVRCQ